MTPFPSQKGQILPYSYPKRSSLMLIGEHQLVLMRTDYVSKISSTLWEPIVVLQMRVPWSKYWFILTLHHSTSPTSPSSHNQNPEKEPTVWNLKDFLHQRTLSPWASLLSSPSLFLRGFHSSKGHKYLLKSISTFISPWQASSSNPIFQIQLPTWHFRLNMSQAKLLINRVCWPAMIFILLIPVFFSVDSSRFSTYKMTLLVNKDSSISFQFICL